MESKKYLQIYDKYANDIINGKINPKEKLPSKRNIAKEFNVSINTVITALDLLEKEGYITLIERIGSIVNDCTNLIKRKELDRTSIKEVSKQTFKYDLTTSKLDNSLFPRATFCKLTKDIIYNDISVFDLGNNSGEDSFKKQICKYLYNYRRIDCNYQNIIIASGTEQLLNIIASILPNKTTYGLEDPGYSKISDVLNNLNKDIIYYNHYKDVLSQVNCIYLTPEHQFPTGVSLNSFDRITLSNWAVNDNYIIEDDYDGEFRYEENIKRSIVSLNKENTIYVSSFSRTLSQSIRISYMILPDKLLEVYHRKFKSYSSQVSKLDQIIVSRFMENKYYERLINKSIVLYKKKRDKILNYLNTHKIKGLSRVSGTTIGLHLLLEFNTMLDENRIIEELNKRSISLNFVSKYSKVFKLEKSILIIGYSSIDLCDIEYCLNEIVEVLNR